LDTGNMLGNWDDPSDLLRFAELVDIVSLENEFVGVSSLEAVEKTGKPVRPGSATLRLIQDKFLQKQTFQAAGLPLPAFEAVESPTDVARLGEQLGWPLVLKARRNAYDGKGNATLRSPEDVPAAWEVLGGKERGLYVEEFCPFVRELAVMVVRGLKGETVVYPVVETRNHNHICHVVLAPAEVPTSVAEEATRCAIRAVNAAGGVGAFGVELFELADGSLRVNEIAPRVHNTGHYTIEACTCSQFENHVRAVMGWPLGSATMRAPAAAMVNLLGAGRGSGHPHGREAMLSVPGAHLHVYGKSSCVLGRKMGHITALGSTVAEALHTAQHAASLIRFGEKS